jgi:hypothetical protein
VVQQHRVLLFAEEAEDALDQRLLLAVVGVGGRKAGGENRIIDGEGYEQEEGDEPDTGHEEAHDLHEAVAAANASEGAEGNATDNGSPSQQKPKPLTMAVAMETHSRNGSSASNQ